MKRDGKIQALENAARDASQLVILNNKEGDQKSRHKDFLDHQKKCDTPKKLIRMIPKEVPGSICHCSHVKRLQELMFQPTKPFRSKFFLEGLFYVIMMLGVSTHTAGNHVFSTAGNH